MPPKPSLLSDELLEDLIAAGEVDILVGLPTHNHAASVAAVVRAVVSAFAGPFVRERTVLLNVDAGSTDGTREAVQSTMPPAELVSAQYTLRTMHRISVPYHGIPGRGTALRILLTAAELLRSRVVVVLDPTTSAISAQDVANFVDAVRRGEADYVKPALARTFADGPLVTQLVRPLFRAAYGFRLLEPIDTQFAGSQRFISGALAAEFWKSERTETGIDTFLTAYALQSGARLTQVPTAARARVDVERRPNIAEVFRQVVGTAIACLAQTYPAWRQVNGSRPVALIGALPEAEPPPQFDSTAFADACRDGVEALTPLLANLLEASLMQRLRTATHAPRLNLDPTLWAEIVFRCVEAAVIGSAPANELAQILEPLYLGRVATFLQHELALDAADPLETLAVAFEAQKLALVTRLEGREK